MSFILDWRPVAHNLEVIQGEDGSVFAIRPRGTGLSEVAMLNEKVTLLKEKGGIPAGSVGVIVALKAPKSYKDLKRVIQARFSKENGEIVVLNLPLKNKEVLL